MIIAIIINKYLFPQKLKSYYYKSTSDCLLFACETRGKLPLSSFSPYGSQTSNSLRINISFVTVKNHENRITEKIRTCKQAPKQQTSAAACALHFIRLTGFLLATQ